MDIVVSKWVNTSQLMSSSSLPLPALWATHPKQITSTFKTSINLNCVRLQDRQRGRLGLKRFDND